MRLPRVRHVLPVVTRMMIRAATYALVSAIWSGCGEANKPAPGEDLTLGQERSIRCDAWADTGYTSMAFRSSSL